MLKRSARKKSIEYNSRLYIVMTAVFLLALLVFWQLFNLQARQHELYTALAADQHSIYSRLQPERGRIYIQDNPPGNDYNLFPLAASRDFGLVYAVPAEVREPENAARELYRLFDAARIEKEVDDILREDEFFAVLEEENGLSPADLKERQEFYAVKRELEIKIRQGEAMEGYMKKLTKPLDPYEPIRRRVGPEILQELNRLDLDGIEYILEKQRYYPEKEIGSHFLGFVGYQDEELSGRYGLEGFFDIELSGESGQIRAEKSAKGGVIIINDRQYLSPKNGSDLVLSINRAIQFTACAKLAEAVERLAAEGGSVLVMDPYSGSIMAMCSLPDYDPNAYWEVEDINTYNNPVIFDAYEPGSIFKVFTMAAGIDQGKVKPSTTYEDRGFVEIEGWPKPIKNSDYESHGGHGVVDMSTVLNRSLNTGSIFVMERTGAEIFADYVKKFGFGEKTGIELETEGLSDIRSLERKTIRPVEAATASFGQGITATPLQLLTAFSAVVNGGKLLKPWLVEKIIEDDGYEHATEPTVLRRVISEKASLLTSGMMVNVVDQGQAWRAGVDGYYVGGKTGTAQVADREKGGYLEEQAIHTFIGFAPAERPRFVMLVKLDKPANAFYSSTSAAPLFGEIAEFILNYLQVPKDR